MTYPSYQLQSGVVVLALALFACTQQRPQSDAPAVAPAGLPPAPFARFVKLEQLSERNGQPWASVAEFNLLDATGATVDRHAWRASADSWAPNDGPGQAIDGDPRTLWHSAWDGNAPPPPHALTISLGAAIRVSGFRYLPRQDAGGNGTIARYRFYVSDDGIHWSDPVSSGDLSVSADGLQERAVVFAAQTENHPPVAVAPPAQRTPFGATVSLKIDARDLDGDPLAYAATGLPPGLSISAQGGLVSGTPIVPGHYPVELAVTDNKGLAARQSFNWTVDAPAASSEPLPASGGGIRFVKLEELSEAQGQAWASVAEFNLIGEAGETLPRTGWKASADSSDTSDRPENAIDGDPSTLWHSQWDGTSPPPPHSLIVELPRPTRVGGFRYLPRQDGLSHGAIARFRFYVSLDGVAWGQPVAQGNFATMGGNSAEKTVLLHQQTRETARN